MNGENSAMGRLHPVPALIYLLSVIFITMFSPAPVILSLSLVGGALFCASVQSAKQTRSDIGFYLPLFVLIAVTNPLFSHDGVTPLFFMNGNPVTLEALLYGVDIAAMMISVLIWCKCFSIIITTDKTLYLLGGVFPKLSLVLSISLRYIPLMKKKWRQIKDAQIAMGYYSESGFTAKLMSSARVFSALVTWSLENAVNVGASMKARGYGATKRTHFSLFRFTVADGVFTFAAIVLAGAAFIGMWRGKFDFSFYPRMADTDLSFEGICFYALFAVFVFIPFIFGVTEAVKWKYLRSKI